MNAVGVALLGVAPDVVTLTAQVTCLLLLALALAWLGRRGSPRTLHLLWTTTFVLVLALPLLGPIGPSWEVPLLPATAGESRLGLSPASGTTPLADLVRVPLSDTTKMRETLVLAELARLDARSGGWMVLPRLPPRGTPSCRSLGSSGSSGACSRWYRWPPPPFGCGGSCGRRILCAIQSGRVRPRSCGTGWASAAGYGSCQRSGSDADDGRSAEASDPASGISGDLEAGAPRRGAVTRTHPCAPAGRASAAHAPWRVRPLLVSSPRVGDRALR